MKTMIAVCIAMLFMTSFVSSNNLLDNLGVAKNAEISAFYVLCEFGNIDLSSSNGILKFDGSSPISTSFTYVYPITNPTDAATKFATLLKLKNVKTDGKFIYFSFYAYEITKVLLKRREKVGDAFSLEVDRSNQGLTKPIRLTFMTHTKFLHKDALYKIIDEL